MEIQPMQEAVPSVQTSPPNDTATFLTKLLVAIILGPKVAPLLAQLGINLDPTLVAVAVGGLLHKLHLLLQKETGWNWL